MQMKYLSCLLLVVLGACNQRGQTNKSTETFIFSNDTISRKLVVEMLSGDSIRFSIQVTNMATKDTSEIHGIAIKHDTGDGAEIDEDLDGTGAVVDEYHFRDDCQLALRIDADKHSFARVNDVNCAEKRSAGVAFESADIMSRVAD